MAIKKIKKDKKINSSFLNLKGVEIFRHKEQVFNLNTLSDYDSDPYNKILIFDINPSNDQITNEFLVGNLSNVIKRLSTKMQLIFTSFYGFNKMKEILIKNLKLKSGFIVCNNGSLIYDIKTNKFLYKQILSMDECYMIVHNNIMQNFLVLASGEKNEYVYSPNLLLVDDFKKNVYLKFINCTRYRQFNNLIMYNGFFNILCYEKYSHELASKYEDIKECCIAWDLNISQINNNMFSINPKNATKINAIQLILEKLKFSNSQKIYYFCLNTFHFDCWFAFAVNHYINVDCLIKNKPFLKFQYRLENVYYPNDLASLILKLLKLDDKEFGKYHESKKIVIKAREKII